MKDPTWWTEHESNAWERCREALLRDWEQTKADLSGKMTGHDLHQAATDTVKQVVGVEVIPPPDVPNDLPDFSHAEPAYRYGAGAAAGRRAAEDQEWNEMIELELQEEWIELTPTQPWESSRHFVRRGWEVSRAKDQSGKIGWALLWLLGIPLPVLLILFLIRGQ